MQARVEPENQTGEARGMRSHHWMADSNQLGTLRVGGHAAFFVWALNPASKVAGDHMEAGKAHVNCLALSIIKLIGLTIVHGAIWL